MTALDRRSFLKLTGGAAGATFVGNTLLQALTAAAGAQTQTPDRRPGDGSAPFGSYGPLQPIVPANEPGGFPYLALPKGFSYVVFAKTGAPMPGGQGVFARNHDGMAAFALADGRVRLTRNQEDRNPPGQGTVGGPVATKYDPLGGGGVTVLDFNQRSRELVNSFIGINGTIVNCAGGIAFGDAGWLSCEETTAGPPNGWAEKHGYVFFLPKNAGATVDAEPLKALGRMSHEAVVADPRSGILYETEDAGSGKGSGFYRFLPAATNDLGAGGRLQMLAVVRRPQADLREGQTEHRPLPARWVDITDPDPDLEGGATRCFDQGFAAGGAKFNRLEGIWAGEGSIFFASTSGGDAKNGDINADGFAEGYGQIWEYRPTGRSIGLLRLIFESSGGTVLDSPDNLTVSPRGGLVLCEDDASSADGDTHPLAPGITDVNRLIGLTQHGETFELAVNRFNDTEFAGACFSPDGHTLFANIFGDGELGSGMTCAITGPWERGAL